MSKYARILKIDEDRVLLGLLNDKGLCGSGTCEGCSCSTKMQTITVRVDEEEMEESEFSTGMDVEMQLPKGTALDWVLIIFLPVILIGGVSIYAGYMAGLGAGAGGFLLASLLVKYLRRDQRIKLNPLSSGEVS